MQRLPAVDNFIERLVYKPAHFLGGHMLPGLPLALQICGAVSLFENLAHRGPPATRAQVPTYVLIPAFIVSEPAPLDTLTMRAAGASSSSGSMA